MNRVLQWIGVGAITVIVLIASCIAVTWACKLPVWASLDSGWAQAITAGIGIGIAIWVPYKQREDATRADESRRQDEARRIRLAIRDELCALQKNSLRQTSFICSHLPTTIFSIGCFPSNRIGSQFTGPFLTDSPSSTAINSDRKLSKLTSLQMQCQRWPISTIISF